MPSPDWLTHVRTEFRKHKDLAERAAAQVTDDGFFQQLAEAHSIASVMKHVGGNLRSRWRDFLTSDGEKTDRNRDGEFAVATDTRATIEAIWQEGWSIALAELDKRQPADLVRSITIRGESHTVPQAILRSLAHTTYHAGQIVTLARHAAGDKWQTLGVPLGGSAALNQKMREAHGDWEDSPSDPA